jgi:N-acetylglutamate synthase-like GNAT family acetyltransferase
MNLKKGKYSIVTDKSKMDIKMIHGFLSHSYWAENIPIETVQRSIEGSLCFGVFDGEKQIGFARLITDRATFAYLADVFILEAYRGLGLCKWMMEAIMTYAELHGMRRVMLATRDAHGLYAQFGFTPLNNVDRWMQIHNPDIYKR